jgi:hypothetical protein
MDWRTRKVTDKVWMVMGSIGIALMALQMIMDSEVLGTGDHTYRAGHFLIFIPVCMLFADLFWDRAPLYGEGKVSPVPVALYSTAALAMAALAYIEGLTPETGQLLAVPLLMLAFLAFYYMDLIYGGADATALISLAILFPFYPAISGLPLIQYPEAIAQYVQVTYPFAFLILMNSAILHVLFYPALNIARNIRNSDYGLPMLFGYKMDIDDIPKNFVWPMEVVRDGEIVMRYRPRKSMDIGAELAELRSKGATRIWVTSKNPFIISILAGIIFSVVVGNLVALAF